MRIAKLTNECFYTVVNLFYDVKLTIDKVND